MEAAEQATDSRVGEGGGAVDAEALEALEASRHSGPWVPSSFSVTPVGRSKTTVRKGKALQYWDVRWRVDGWAFRKRFIAPQGTAEQARTWAKRLQDDFARGWAFDPNSRSFVDPTTLEAGAPPPTVFTCCLDYLDRKWDADWEPKSRQMAVRSLRRACEKLLRPGAPEPGSEVGACLDTLLCGPGKRPSQLEPDTEKGRAFLLKWSAPIASVTRDELEAFVVLFRKNQRNPTKSVSPSTERRFVADLKQMWADAAVRHEFANPWPTIRVRTRTRHGRSTSGRVIPVSRDVVLSPDQIMEMADACVRYGSWDEDVRCFVLIMGFCGLRPGEAMALRIGDLELRHEEGMSWVEVKRSRRRVQERWLEPGEDPEWGPLKDRGIGESRRVPIPAFLADLLSAHIDETFFGEIEPPGLIFHRNGRPIVPSNFMSDVWHPARAAVFPSRPGLPLDDPRQPAQARLRCHDLRHAACSMWLNARVDPKVCQKWSGHRTLSVFLDVYQGIMPGREEEGVQMVENFLDQMISPGA